MSSLRGDRFPGEQALREIHLLICHPRWMLVCANPALSDSLQYKIDEFVIWYVSKIFPEKELIG